MNSILLLIAAAMFFILSFVFIGRMVEPNVSTSDNVVYRRYSSRCLRAQFLRAKSQLGKTAHDGYYIGEMMEIANELKKRAHKTNRLFRTRAFRLHDGCLQNLLTLQLN